jgi:hypothetical protein
MKIKNTAHAVFFILIKSVEIIYFLRYEERGFTIVGDIFKPRMDI